MFTVVNNQAGALPPSTMPPQMSPSGGDLPVHLSSDETSSSSGGSSSSGTPYMSQTTSRASSTDSNEPDVGRVHASDPVWMSRFRWLEFVRQQTDNIRTLLRHLITLDIPFLNRWIQAAQLPPSGAASTVPQFPNEILLHCFSFMTLKALIACRCVCASWRSLVPHAELDPLRRRLLELYDTIINASYFLETRPWIVAHLDPTFDREAYIATLEAQDPTIRVPPAFRLFILEWPALAAVQSLWPGLPLLDCRKSNIERKKGVNFIARTHPELSALTYKLGYPGVAFIPALLLWRNAGDSTDWLILDDDHFPELSGKVFAISLRLDPDIVPYCEWGEGPEDRTDYHTLVRRGNYNDFIVYHDWIEYLQRMWHNLSICTPFGPVSRNVLPHDDVLVCSEGNDDFSDHTHHDIPAPPWTRRTEPRFWQRLEVPE